MSATTKPAAQNGKRVPGIAEGLFRAQIIKNFPAHAIPGFESIRPNQDLCIDFIAQNPLSVIEGPTGLGKTGVQYAALRARASIGGLCFWVFPTKTIMQQVARSFTDIHCIYGRNEFPCYCFNEDKRKLTPETAECRASDVPCAMLVHCPHRVDQTTGQTYELGAVPCPYLQRKFEAKKASEKGSIIACTMAFYLFSVVFAKEWPRDIDMVVFDEVDQLPGIVRKCMSTTISADTLAQIVDMLEHIGIDDVAGSLKKFKKLLIDTVGKCRNKQAMLLSDTDTLKLINQLERVSQSDMKTRIAAAVRTGSFGNAEYRVALKHLETICHSLNRWLMALKYCLPEEARNNPTNYVYSAYEPGSGPIKGLSPAICIKCYQVGPIIRKMCAPMTCGMSATIGDPVAFKAETGMYSVGKKEFRFISLESDFPVDNTAILLPSDAANLATTHRRKSEPRQTISNVAVKARWFSLRGCRSALIVISNDELEMAVNACRSQGLKVMTYGKHNEGIKPKEAAERFRKGEGDILIGTSANYSSGIDLPRHTCPVIFFLRPSYANPTDPEAQFEEKRFGKGCWGVRRNRVVREALQVRGRNMRSGKDRGITIFMSAQFRGLIRFALPAWLKASYRSDLGLDGCCEHGLKVIQGKSKPAKKAIEAKAASTKTKLRVTVKKLPTRIRSKK